MQGILVVTVSLLTAHLVILAGFVWGADDSLFGGSDSCFKAKRSLDQTNVILYIGSPPKRTTLLLRVDRAAGAGNAIFRVSRRVFERSETVDFASSSIAYDRVVVSSAESTSQGIAVAQFEIDEEVPPSVDGVLFAPTGATLELRGGLLCLKDTQLQLRNHVFVTQDGTLETDVGVDPCHGDNKTARLFPSEAGDEGRWLGLLPSSGAAHKRRLDVERGVGSLANVTAPSDGSACMAQASKSYAWHCISDKDCMQQSSVVFRRRVAHDDLIMSLGPEDGSFDVVQGPSGYQRMALSHDTETVDAFVRLLLVLLAAAVTILRRRSKSINVRSHIRRAIDECRSPRDCKTIRRVFTNKCPEAAPLNATPEQEEPVEPVKDVKAEAVVGMLAITGRVVAITMSADLVTDTLVASEIAAIVSSALHLVSRHPPILADCDKVSPVSKLGGSMASNDVAAALLVSLAQTPFSDGFRPVGRLLAVSLISLTCLSQSMFAVVSMSIVAFKSRGNGRDVSSFGYRSLCAFSGLLWSVELFSAGYAIAELFAMPFAADLHRSSHVHTLFTQLNLSLVALLVSAPMRNRIVRSCSKDLQPDSP